MSEEILRDAWSRSKVLDLAKIGLNATTETLSFFDDKEKRFINYIDTLKTLALAIVMERKNAIKSETAYIIRDLSPMEDLLAGGKRIEHNQWLQDDYRIGKAGDEYFADIYTTDREVRNHDKAIMIYGLELLNPFKNNAAQRIEFWRGSVKLIAWLDIGSLIKESPINYQKFMVPRIKEDDGGPIEINGDGMMLPHTPIYQNPTVYFTTPIFYKMSDLMKIRVKFDKDKLKLFDQKYDEIKIKGFVIEPIGSTMMG